MPEFKLEDFLPYRLSILSQTVSGLIAKEYETRFGLTMNQWRCLVIISNHGAITAKDISAQTLVDKMTVSRAVKSLHDRGLITAKPSPHDARARLLIMTKAGLRIYDEILPIAQAYEKTLVLALSDSQKNSLDISIYKLIQAARELY